MSYTGMTARSRAARLEARQKRLIIALLSCLVVLATAAALMVPAISATEDTLTIQGNEASAVAESEAADVEEAAEEESAAEAADETAAATEGDVGEPAEATESPADESVDEPYSGDYEETGSEPEYIEDEASDMPAQSFVQEFKNKNDEVTFVVNVDAPEGALPAGTTMEAEKVKAAKVQDAVDEAVAEKTDAKVDKVEAVKIVFKDADGNEINPNADVAVTMASSQLDADSAAYVVNVDQEGGAAVVDQLSDKELASRDQELEDNELAFDTDAGATYAIAYTVDFEYEVIGGEPGEGEGEGGEPGDGEDPAGDADDQEEAGKKTYTYTLQGGGALSVRDLLVSFGIVKQDEAEAFMGEIATVEFSNPELIRVEKIETDTTVGELKSSLGLEPQYSSTLTEGQVDAINGQTLSAPDWVLVSMKPFESKETLTITMTDGKSYVVKVTDAAVNSLNNIDGSKGYVIYTEKNGKYYVLKTDGTTVEVSNRADLDAMDNDYKWTFSYVYTDFFTQISYYNIRPVGDNSKTLALNWSTYDNNPLVQQGANNVSLVPLPGGGYTFGGYNNTTLTNYDNGWFYATQDGSSSRIVVYEQEQLAQYTFTVTTDDYSMGYVWGRDAHGDVQTGAEYDSITNADKTNYFGAVAAPQSDKYLFDYWDLNGTRLSNGDTIFAGTLPIPYQGSTLTAHFKRNPNWQPTEEEKEGRVIDKESLAEWLESFKNKQVPLDPESCNKTAEVYDYENRIYRVDLTAKSNLETFDGNVDLGFILDVSGSMKFPSRLKKIENYSSVDVGRLNEVTASGWWGERHYWQDLGLDTSKYYYVIAEKSTRATVFRLFYEGGVWKRVDASYANNDSTNVKTIGASDAKFGEDGIYPTYPLYEDDDAPNQRLKYEQESLDNTITELNSILNMLSLAKNSNDDPNVKVAWNTFCATVNASDHTFKSVKNKDDINITYTYSGGTRTDSALNDARSFGWESSATKYAILITDGAPQYGGSQHPSDLGNDLEKETARLVAETKTQADALKSQGVNLITVGLSMKDVKVGSVLLYDIASKDENGDPYFYSADSGDELEYVLYEIIQKIVKPAVVQGNVTDTINEAFYPVDKATGKPLENGDKIDLNGNLTNDTSKPYGTIRKNGDKYTVDWSEQEFDHLDGWHGSVYVKAKEDFLGGNAVMTNAGEAEIQANKYKLEGSSAFVEFNDETKAKGHKEFETPRVNVNELNLQENSSEWTVYLGTEVDPVEELKRLYKSIQFEEVVIKNGAADANGDGFKDVVVGDQANYRYPLEADSIVDNRESQMRGEPETFYLKDLVKNITGSEELDWNKLIADAEKSDAENEGISIRYTKYNVPGYDYIKIRLVKNVVAEGETGLNPSPHTTTVTGRPVESYTLSVVYEPDYSVCPVGQGGNADFASYHVGTYGTAYQGTATGEDYSYNTHKINVFSKGLQITKTDDSFTKILTGAKFELYRTARNGDANTRTLPGAQGNYTKVADLDTSETGTAIKNPVERLNAGETYYLLETDCPAGYNRLDHAVPVHLNITDSYTLVPSGTAAGSQPASDPYNWVETASLTLSIDDAQKTNAAGDAVEAQVAPDSETATMYYKIKNHAGTPLPNTGGPGTGAPTILGVLMLALGAALLFRPRSAWGKK